MVKSIVGLVFSIIGSVINIILSIVLFVLFVFSYLGRKALIENGLSDTLINFSGTISLWLLVLTFVFFVVGILGIIGSSMMTRDSSEKKGALMCFISGILTLNPFLFIGGLLGFFVSNSSPNYVTVSY